MSDTIYATDATPSSGGAVEVKVNQKIAMALHRSAEVRGCHVRLDDLPGVDMHKLVRPSADIDSLALSLPWSVRSAYKFRFSGHINLQEARAIKFEVRRLAAELPGPIRIIFLCDSQVCVGAIGKGRSSSFKLNGILRSMLGHLIAGRIVLRIVWVSTGANPGDYPSRFAALPTPSACPDWVCRLVGEGSRVRAGCGQEVFSGVGVVTSVFRKRGHNMKEPFDNKLHSCDDILDPQAFDRLIGLIRSGAILWIWFAVPCQSFTALQNGHRDGPWRAKDRPEGFGRPEVLVGNKILKAVCALIVVAIECGVYFAVENPATSYLWNMPCMRDVIAKPGVQSVLGDMCMYTDLPRDVPVPRKPLRFVGTLPWLPQVIVRCDGRHQHTKHLCNISARKSAAYTTAFATALAVGYELWSTVSAA